MDPWALLIPYLAGVGASLLLAALACLCARERRPAPGVAAAAVLAGATIGWIVHHGWHAHVTSYQDLVPLLGIGFTLTLLVRAAVPVGAAAVPVDAGLAGIVAGIGALLLWQRVAPGDRPAPAAALVAGTAVAVAIAALIAESAVARIPAWVGRGVLALALGAIGAGTLAATLDLGLFVAILAGATVAPLALVFWRVPVTTTAAAAIAALAWLATLAWMDAPWSRPLHVLVPMLLCALAAIASGHLALLAPLQRRPRLALVVVIVTAVVLSGAAAGWAVSAGAPAPADAGME